MFRQSRNSSSAKRTPACPGAAPRNMGSLAIFARAAPGAQVIRWVDGRTLEPADVRETAVLERIVHTVLRCHRDIPAHFHGATTPIFWVFQVVRAYARILREDGSRMTGRLDDLLGRATRLESAVGPVEIVFGHNDLLSANFIDDGDRIWLIDWEYAGFNSPLFDLGGLASNNEMDAEQERRMMERYFGASLLRDEAMWSMVSEFHSDIDFDYVAYTGENLECFERAWEALGQ